MPHHPTRSPAYLAALAALALALIACALAPTPATAPLALVKVKPPAALATATPAPPDAAPPTAPADNPSPTAFPTEKPDCVGAPGIGDPYFPSLGNGGYQVSIDTQSGATAGNGAVAGNPGGATVAGQTLQVAGISQLSQIAGDDNRVGNLATIGVVSKLPGVAGFNGQASTTTTQGAYQAQVSFVGGGLRMGLLGPDSQVTQRLGVNGADGGISQVARIAGNGQIAQNQMAMQVQVAPMSQALQQQLGVQQALSSLLALRR